MDNEAEEFLAHLAGRVKFTFWDDVPLETLLPRVEGLSEEHLVFLRSVLRDKTGRAYSYVESARMLREVCPVPLYGGFDFFLGEGMVGGKLVSGVSQGRLAAHLALRILHGESPEAIPVLRADANTYMFDDIELRRFNVPPSSLPPKSLVINRPSSLYSLSKTELWILAGVGAAMSTVIIVLVWNIRSRKKAEEALRDSEQRLRLALEGSQDGMWDWNAVTGENRVDERWCSMLGFTRDEIREDIEQWKSLVHPEELPVIVQTHQQCMDGFTSHFSGEFRMRTKSGDWKWILGRGKVVERDTQGRPLRLTGTHKDISRQKADEQALKAALAESRRSKDKIDAILASISDGLIVSDTGGRIILANLAATDMLGLKQGEAEGERVEDILKNDAFLAGLAKVSSGETESPAIDLELFDRHRQEVRVVQTRLCLFHRQGEMDAGVITLLQDVTGQREMERVKREFISTAAHELRTPLTAILGFADLLQEIDTFTPEEQKEYLGIISQKTEALAEIVDNLLDLSRIESGRLIALNRTSCDLGAMIPGLVDQYRRGVPDRHFETELHPEGSLIAADRGKIGQVMENLFSNAVKYSHHGSTVRVTSRIEDDWYLISVADNGIGMSPEQLERVFDKFYRANSGDTSISGLGLGMSIVKNIVEAHGGTIQVES